MISIGSLVRPTVERLINVHTTTWHTYIPAHDIPTQHQNNSFGGLFLGDVELLRTTTPEPSPQGITWHVEKDVSDYMTYILDPLRPKTAVLSIPNVIDGTYTGVLYVNATLSFYGRKPATSTASSAAAAGPGPISTLEDTTEPATDPDSSSTTKNLRGPGSSGNMGPGSGGNMGEGPPTLDGTRSLVPEEGARPPLVLPLAAPSMPMMKLLRLNKSSGGGSSFWASMAVSGNDSIEVPLPEWPQPNIARVHLDLFATPHQCEEVRKGSGQMHVCWLSPSPSIHPSA